MSRHHYDIIKLMETEFAEKALKDKKLFSTIAKHRQQINFLNYVDYSKHERGKINIIPPESILKDLEKDYLRMKEEMIYGKAPTFNSLMQEIEKINHLLNEKTP